MEKKSLLAGLLPTPVQKYGFLNHDDNLLSPQCMVDICVSLIVIDSTSQSTRLLKTCFARTTISLCTMFFFRGNDSRLFIKIYCDK